MKIMLKNPPEKQNKKIKAWKDKKSRDYSRRSREGEREGKGGGEIGSRQSHEQYNETSPPGEDELPAERHNESQAS